MLSRWLQRGSIGQILAPDPAMKDEEVKAEESEFKGGLWNVIAPDPNFQSPEKSNSDNEEIMIVTPTKESTTTTTTTTLPSSPSNGEKVEHLVLSAAKDLAYCVASPPIIWEDHKKFFNYCASTTPLSEKQLKRVKKMLTKDPSLANCRASKMGFLIPDGFTPLHAAAFVGNYDVALILIDFCSEGGSIRNSVSNTEKEEGGDKNDNGEKEEEGEEEKEYIVSLDARDVQGRTALHIASEQGHVRLVKLLKMKMSERNPEGIIPVGEHAPIDLTGKTPLGCAATSRESMACQFRDELRVELFSPGDKSVFGKKTPALDRTGGRKMMKTDSLTGEDSMDLLYGFAEMPGLRIEMEDAICHSFPIRLENAVDKNVTEVGLFGVFDGHGDGGIASQYVADHILQCLIATQEWKEYNGETHFLSQALAKACSDIDIDLRAMSDSNVRHGGSTGIMALITQNEIIVGNVGDSRCILVQKGSKDDLIVEAPTTEVELVEENDNSTLLEKDEKVDEHPQSQLPEKLTKVTALSIDHKPNLPEEKIRIEKAGLEVIEESFPSGEKEGEMASIWKIQKSARDKIAVSRAFGDFDYKANEDLKVDEQAIISVPDFTIHQRDNTNDLFLVLACDGVFDVMSNDEVGQFVAKRSNKFSKDKGSLSAEMLPEVGDDLLKHCLDLGSSDNMSVLIVALPGSRNSVDSAPRKLEFADI